VAKKKTLAFQWPTPALDATSNNKGKGLQLQFTVEDDGVFTKPWSATETYRRPLVPLEQWPERVCAENANGYNVRGKAAVPTADKPHF
jgi:hypothetical protein